MKYLALFGIAALFLVGVFHLLTYVSPEEAALRAAEVRIAQLEAQAAHERAQAQAEALEPLSLTLAAFWHLVPAVVVVGGLALAVDHYYTQRRLVRADGAGLLPVARTHLLDHPDASLATLAAFHTTQLEAARRPVLPDKLHYAPHYSSKGETAVPALVDEPVAAPLVVPPFRELFGTHITLDGPMLLGFTDDGPLMGAWRDLYSTAVAGLSGSGKSNTQRFLIAQAALQGARFCVIDPHMETSPEDALAPSLAPLHQQMICAPVSDANGILQTVKLITSRLDARLSGDKDRTPLLYVIDEFTQCMRREDVAAALALLLERIATEGRKVAIFAMLGGQTWGAARSGGTPLRNALASAYVHRSKRAEVLKLLQMGEDTPRDTHALPTGGGYFLRTSGELVRVQVPLTTAADIAHVAAMLQPVPTTSTATTSATSQQIIDTTAEVTSVVDLEGASGSQWKQHQNAIKPLSPQHEQLRQMIREKRSQKEMLVEVLGCHATAGREWTQAVERLREMMAELV